MGGVENRIGLHRGVLAFSHRKQSEDFSKKNRRIVITKNQLARSLMWFSTGAHQDLGTHIFHASYIPDILTFHLFFYIVNIHFFGVVPKR